MVSPVDKNGGDILAAPTPLPTASNAADTALDQSQPSGAKLTYTSSRAFGDCARRRLRQPVHGHPRRLGLVQPRPLPAPRHQHWHWFPLPNAEFAAFTADLSSAFLLHDTDPPIAPGAVPGFHNLYRRDNTAESYEALTTVAPPNPNFVESPKTYEPILQGFSADASHVVFTANDALTPEAPELVPTKTVLYESFQGKLSLVSVLPDGSPATERL